jgi:predicted metal-dependent enzyme (double-stranded beta helix superfamily)
MTTSLFRAHHNEPPRLSLAALAEYTRFVADEVQAGSYPQIEYDEQERWHQRLYRDARVDLWLISWMPTQGTQLHDHGGSAGAFTVVRGCLDESVHRAEHAQRLLERRRVMGSTVSFGPHYVHDVRNVCAEPAVSVHAYSPPLTVMNYYDLDGSSDLRLIARLDTDDPEADVALAPRLAG